MSAGRFFVPPETLAQPEQVILPPNVAAQIKSVLRLRVGDSVTLLDGTGDAYTLTLTDVGREQVTGRVTARATVHTEPRTPVILNQGLLKAAKFEWIVQKGTELGMATIAPVQCVRSVVEDVSASKLARWRAIATEAAEQSDRGCAPGVRQPQPLVAALAECQAGDLVLLAWEAAGSGDMPAMTIAQAIQAMPQPTAIHLYIGPEGGFTATEVDQARSHGAQIVTLGPRILRAETAAIAALTLTLSALGEME